VVSLSELTEARLTDSFMVGIEFLQRARTFGDSPPYPLITWNYMPPSGGGLVHPHQQCFATSYPGNQYMDELRASERFYETHHANFWAALVEEEARIGERYLGRLGSCHWLTPFMSLGVLGDILCIFPDALSIDDFREAQVRELVNGLRSVFSYYQASGICSFNAALFFGPAEQNYFSTHFRIIPRTFLNMRDFAPDPNFLQMLMGEAVSVVMPEDVCRDARTYFD
jgi:galactose-1-phosphate uridylyltransferase